MSTVVWISGASAGIGAALAATVPFPQAQIFDISRSGGTPGTSHVPADLSDPAVWPTVSDHMRGVIDDVSPDRALLIHCAATLQPIGPVHDVGGRSQREDYNRQVVLNSAAPQVIGAAFVAAVAAGPDTIDATVVMLSSGAASSVYEGWSAYSAGKAAINQWVKTAGAEQSRLPHPVRVIAVSPGVVDTAMQAEIRTKDEASFPAVTKFMNLHAHDELITPKQAAEGIWRVSAEQSFPNGSVVDLRALP